MLLSVYVFLRLLAVKRANYYFFLVQSIGLLSCWNKGRNEAELCGDGKLALNNWAKRISPVAE